MGFPLVVLSKRLLEIIDQRNKCGFVRSWWRQETVAWLTIAFSGRLRRCPPWLFELDLSALASNSARLRSRR